MSATIRLTRKTNTLPEHKITLTHIPYDISVEEHAYIQINGQGEWIDILNDEELHEFENVSYFNIYYIPFVDISMVLINTNGGYPDADNPDLSQYDVVSATSKDKAVRISITEDCDVIMSIIEQ